MVRNGSMNPHNFHIHNATFNVVDIDGEPPAPARSGHKDTVYVPPGSTVRLAVSFGHHVDERHPYMAHCHILIHEDTGMMLQFLIVEPGREQEVDLRLDLGHEHH